MKMEYLASCYLSKIIRWHIKHNQVMPLKGPAYNMRANRQDNFRQSKAEHATSPVSHITFKGESVDAWNGHSCTRYLPRTEGVTIEEEDPGYNIGKRGNEEEINRPSMANINRHQGQMGVR